MATIAVSASGGPAVDVQNKLDDGGERRDVYVTSQLQFFFVLPIHSLCSLIAVFALHNQSQQPQ